MAATARNRAIQRAIGAWRRGRPYTAYQILADAGLGKYWPEFHRVALRASREYARRRLSAGR